LIQGSSCFSRFACADPQMEYIMSFWDGAVVRNKLKRRGPKVAWNFSQISITKQQIVSMQKHGTNEIRAYWLYFSVSICVQVWSKTECRATFFFRRKVPSIYTAGVWQAAWRMGEWAKMVVELGRLGMGHPQLGLDQGHNGHF
jgi:hypothetical protein